MKGPKDHLGVKIAVRRRRMESFVLLSALGGECIDDMKRLREDAGLAGIRLRRTGPPTAGDSPAVAGWVSR
ncbi:MAG: hypothetical protein V1724_02775 [Chloroflexota bacterium]